MDGGCPGFRMVTLCDLASSRVLGDLTEEYPGSLLLQIGDHLRLPEGIPDKKGVRIEGSKVERRREDTFPFDLIR